MKSSAISVDLFARFILRLDDQIITNARMSVFNEKELVIKYVVRMYELNLDTIGACVVDLQYEMMVE